MESHTLFRFTDKKEDLIIANTTEPSPLNDPSYTI